MGRYHPRLTSILTLLGCAGLAWTVAAQAALPPTGSKASVRDDAPKLSQRLAAPASAFTTTAQFTAELIEPVDVVFLQPTHWAYLAVDGQLASPWIPFADAGAGSMTTWIPSAPADVGGIAGSSGPLCAGILAFDGAEIDPLTAQLVGASSCVASASPAARRLLDVGSDGNRANDCIPLWSQGFQTASGSENVRAESAVVGFYWRVTGSACINDNGTPNIGADDTVNRSSEPCVIAIGTGEGFGNCATGATNPAGTEPVYAGFAFRMPNNVDRNGNGVTTDTFDGLASSVVDCRGGVRFYVAVINLCGVSSFLMPADGFGHFTIGMLTLDASDQSGNTLLKSTCAAPLAWGPDEPNGENRPGAASETAWLDLNNDGNMAPTPPECAQMLGSCPQALSAAVSFLHRVDSDHDSWPDAADNCPSVPNANQLDSDGDQVGDACDGCPNDPLKTQPGPCGCGRPDVLGDIDEDGVIDCVDGCPNDPEKTMPGVCGCGHPEDPDLHDANHDDIPDCMQDCSVFVAGDFDGNGEVNNFDIDSFIEALVDPETYQAREGIIAWRCRAIVNRDPGSGGGLTNFDIDPFVTCLVELRSPCDAPSN